MTSNTNYMLGQIMAMLKAQGEDIAELKDDIKSRVNPAIDDYKTLKHKLMGASAIISIIAGIGANYIQSMWKN